MIRAPRAWASVPRRTTTTAADHVSFRSLPQTPLRPLQSSQHLLFHRIARHTSTKTDTQHPTAQTAPQSSKTIPGPGWLWLEPIYEPFRAYGRVQQRRPYVTQFLSAVVIYFVGDIVAQSLTEPPPRKVEEESKGWVMDWVEGRDWARTCRALLIGGAAAVPGYKWFLWLGESFNYGSKILSLTTKVSVNQLLFTPIFNSYFFGMQYALTTPMSSFSFHDLAERLQHTVPVSWVNSCKIWPAVTAFSFTFIPIMYRSIFGGVIAIGWQTYLSLLNQRAEKEGEVLHGVEAEVGSADKFRERREEEDEREEGKCAA